VPQCSAMEDHEMSRRVIKIPNILEEINLALTEGYHRFLLVVGEKNLGKSTLCLLILYEIFKRKGMDDREAWSSAFRQLCFTPRQFYEFYTNAKGRIDKALSIVGLDPSILSIDVEENWDQLIERVMVLDTNVEDFTKIRESYRIPSILIDDMGAHMNRQDVSIYYDPFFQMLFADLTLIRPYIAVLMATAPNVNDIPRTVLRHVTDVIQVEKQGRARYKKIRNFIRFKSKNIEGFLKLYDGDPVVWDPLPVDIYARYEILRHLMSRQVSLKAQRALIEADLKMGYIPPLIH
jgi:hypothetical protein